MARPFNVTAAADSVRLDSQGRGATTYTVSNISGRALRGRARLVPGNPAQSSWLSIEREAERDFTADGTQQYVVKIAVPPGAPAGKFTFGLDVVSVDNPDEDFTEGPKVAFEVAPPPAKKPFPWWIVAVAVALIVVGGLVAWLLGRHREQPPELPLAPAVPAETSAAAPGPAPSEGCRPGYVWRGTSPSDRVCVTPERRAEIEDENAQAASRYQPGGGYGPSTCRPGYVWRVAFPQDLVCVTPESRQKVSEENAAAARGTGAP